MKKFILAIILILFISAPVFAQQYLWRYRTHATDCTSLTDGKASDLCYEQDDQTIYKCDPSAGNCDTAEEWKTVGGGLSGFTDGGANVYATTTTDNVAIGTTSANSGFKLDVRGNQYVSGNIGVGTVSPRGSVDASQTLYVGSTGEGYLAATDGIGFDGNKDTNIDVTINSSGNLGIGTSNPGYIFETVSSSSNSFNRMIYTGAQSNIGAPVLLFVADPTAAMTVNNSLGRIIFGGAQNVSHSIGNSVSIEAFAGGTFSASSIPGYLVFKLAPSGSTTRSEIMRISPTSVSIGTTSTSNDSLIVKSPATDGIDEAIKVHANGSATSIILMDEPAANKARLRLRDLSTTAIQFDVNSNSYVNTGNFGVGTTSPSSKLQVVGTVDATAFTGDGSGLTGLPSGGGWVDGGVNIYVSPTTDNVGIGTTTPSTKLDVSGGAPRFRSLVSCDTIDTDSNGVLSCGTDDGAGSGGGWTDGGANVYTTTTTDTVGIGTTGASGSLEIVKQGSTIPFMVSATATGDGNYFIVTSAGNVGIGSVIPTNILTVRGSTSASIQAINSSSSGPSAGGGVQMMSDDNAAVVLGDRLGNFTFAGSADTGDTIINGGAISGYADGTWSASSAPTEVRIEVAPSGSTTRAVALVADSTSNIGIGTTTPQQKLQVVGTVAATTVTGANVTSGADPGHTHTTTSISGIDISDDTNLSGTTNEITLTGDTLSLPSAAKAWVDGGTNVYNSTTTDKVGIGTTTPATTLEIVKQSTLAPLYISSSASGAGDYLIIDSAGNIGIGTTTALNQKLTVNGGIATTGASGASYTSGNLGIGTTTPPQALYVVGNVQATTGFISAGNVGISTTKPNPTNIVITNGIITTWN